MSTNGFCRISMLIPLTIFSSFSLAAPYCEPPSQCAGLWVAAQDIGVSSSFFDRGSNAIPVQDIAKGMTLIANREIRVHSELGKLSSNPFNLRNHSSITVGDVEVVHTIAGPQVWIKLFDANSPRTEVLWSGVSKFDPKMRVVVTAQHSGFVLESPEEGQFLRKVDNVTSDEVSRLISGVVPDRIKQNAVAVVQSPFQEDLQRRWFRRKNELLQVMLALNFDSASLDTGNNPAASTPDTKDSELYNLLWGILKAGRPIAEATSPPLFVPLSSIPADLASVPLPSRSNGPLAELLADTKNVLKGQPPSPKLAGILLELDKYQNWSMRRKQQSLGMLLETLVGLVREESLPSAFLSLYPRGPAVLLPNSLRLLRPDKSLQINISRPQGDPNDAEQLYKLHRYWTQVKRDGLYNRKDMLMLSQLAGVALSETFDPEPVASALISEVEAAWKKLIEQAPWHNFSNLLATQAGVPLDKASKLAALKVIVNRELAVAPLSNLVASMPPQESSRVRQSLLEAIDRAVAEGEDPQISLKAIAEDLWWTNTTVFSGRYIKVEAEASNRFLEIKPGLPPLINSLLFRGIDVTWTLPPKELSGSSTINPLMDTQIVRMWRLASLMRGSVGYARSSGRLGDYTKAIDQIKSGELDLSIDEAAEGRNLQSRWWDAERAIHNLVSEYANGHVVLEFDGVIEDSLAKVGQYVGEGDPIAVVRPISKYALVPGEGSGSAIMPGSEYRVNVDCDDLLVLLPRQWQKMADLDKPKSDWLREKLGKIQQRLRASTEFVARVSVPSLTSASSPIMQLDSPEGTLKVAIADSDVVATAERVGITVERDGSNTSLIFDGGLFAPAASCRTTFQRALH